MTGDGQRRVLRFLLSGGTGFLIYYLVALALQASTDIDRGVIAFVSTLVAIPPTFVLQRQFTFRARGNPGRQLGRYLLLQAGVAFVIGASARLATQVAIPAELAFFLAGIVGVVFSYLVQAFLVFSR